MSALARLLQGIGAEVTGSDAESVAERLIQLMQQPADIEGKTLSAQIYAGIGFLCLLLGANFLDYSILSKVLPATDRIMARSHGMLGIEVGVAIAVMAIVVSIYINVVTHGKYDKGL